MQGKYAVFVRANNGTLKGRVSDFTALGILATLNNPGSWSLRSTTPDKCPFEPGDGICVARDGSYFYGGIMSQIQDVFDARTGLYNWQVQGVGDLGYLNRRICYVDPATGGTTTYSHYTDSGYLSVVIERLIARNLGQSAMQVRREPIIEDNTAPSVLSCRSPCASRIC